MISRPKIISVEPTNNCNLNCGYCLVGMQNECVSTEHKNLTRQPGFMDIALFKKIVKDAADFGTKDIQLFFQGEPLLHKGIADMVRLSKAQSLFTSVFTNGLLLDEDLAGRLIKAGLDDMRFSIDGITEETYQQNRRGGAFGKAYQNLQITARKAKGTQLKLTWQFIVMRNNEHEVKEAQKMAEGLGIEFFAKTFAVTNPGLAPANPVYRRRLQIKPCIDIYRNIFVFWDGRVVPCCYDLAGKYVVGDLTDNTISEIWDSAEYRLLRKRISSAADEPSICRSCLKWGFK